MIENIHRIGPDCPTFQAGFQSQILNHWKEIQSEDSFPLKRKFRPQKFTSVLSQLAIVGIDSEERFFDRLTGGTISEILKLPNAGNALTSPPDENIHTLMQLMLKEARNISEPIYFTGRFSPNGRPAIDFSILILPFADNDDNKLDQLLLAFDFSQQPQEELFKAS